VDPVRISRRAALAGLGAVVLAGCAAPGARLTDVALATGGDGGVYRRLGEALAGVWGADLGIRTRVLGSDGSVQNVDLLGAGSAQVVFCAVDVAADAVGDRARPPLAALARVHDDAVHVVVPADSPIRRLADLRGRRVSIGAPSSGVLVIAPRLLATVGLDPRRDLAPAMLGLAESVTALQRGEIDAFFWSGGVPTAGVQVLAAVRPIRLLDLTEEVLALRRAHPVYDVTTVPARTYRLTDPVTTPSVRNVLLVTAALPDDGADDLTRVLLARRDSLAQADPAGRSIDPRTAIGTQPVPLHPGAAAAYRAIKGL
jgi:hypothetical protein